LDAKIFQGREIARNTVSKSANGQEDVPDKFKPLKEQEHCEDEEEKIIK
jgi:hypothetical protein